VPARPKLIGDKDRLIPADLRQKVFEYLGARPELALVRMAIRLAFQAGLRASEICKLKVARCDIFRAPHRILVVGGKKREATHVDPQPIPAGLARDLAIWIKGWKLDVDSYVIGKGGKHSTRYSRQWLWGRVKAVHRACRVPEVFGVHSWRHAYGTLMHQQTGDVLKTQRMMRHRQSTTTERYVHMAEYEAEMTELLKGLELDVILGDKKRAKRSRRKR
jgi:integrase